MGGIFGRGCGIPRRVRGMTGSTSSSEGRRTGDGERERAGRRVGTDGTAVDIEVGVVARRVKLDVWCDVWVVGREVD